MKKVSLFFIIIFIFSLSLVSCDEEEPATNPPIEETPGGEPSDEPTHNLIHHQRFEPTCTEDGMFEYWYCKDCDKYYLDENESIPVDYSDLIIEATGHLDIEYIEGVEATCLEPGSISYWHCKTCDTYFTELEPSISLDDTLVPAKGHSFGEWTLTSVRNCLSGDKYVRQCKDCGFEEQREDSELGRHNVTWVDYTVETCTSDGCIVHFKCRDCHKYFSDADATNELQEEDVIIKGGHTLTHTPGVEATCYDGGYHENWHCSVCNKYFGDEACTIELETLDIEPLEHSYDEYNNCTRCNHNPYIEYILRTDPDTNEQYYELFDLLDGISGEVLIPETYRGLPIRHAIYNPFYNNQTITKLIIEFDLSSIDNYEFYNWSALKEIVLPNTLENIGEGAFSNCISLERVVIPSSVSSIGEEAFSDCIKLESVIFESNSHVTSLYYTFADCTSLKEVVLPDSLVSLDITAFRGCSNLMSVVIPSSVTTIDYKVFSNPYKLVIYAEPSAKLEGWADGWNAIDTTSIPVIWNYKNNDLDEEGYKYVEVDGIRYAINESLAKVTPSSFSGDVVIPEVITYEDKTYPVKAIDSYAFANCDLTSITLSSSLESLDKYAFAYANIDSINIPEGIVEIPSYAFYNASISSVNLPSSITSIGEYAFAYTALETFDIPICVVEIPSRAFYYSNLSSIEIPSSITSIGEYAFAFTKLASIEIPDSISVLPDGLFAYAEDLVSVKLPSTITQIPYQCFTHCSSLKEVNIPFGVDIIGNSAFSDCVSLENVELPTSLEIIGGFTFANCQSLTRLTIPSRIEFIYSYAFDNCYKLVIFTKINSGPSSQWYDNWNPDNRPIVWRCHENNLDQFGYEHIVVDNINYAIKDGVAEVTGNTLSGDIVLNDTITYEGNTYTVGTIRAYAFYNLSNLTSVVIPTSVTDVGYNAFGASNSELKLYLKASAIPSGWDTNWNPDNRPVELGF